MIKFKHKKHMHESRDDAKIIIYYNISDIFLGTALLILVVFFIHDYLSHALGVAYQNEPYVYNRTLPINFRTNSLIPKP